MAEPPKKRQRPRRRSRLTVRLILTPRAAPWVNETRRPGWFTDDRVPYVGPGLPVRWCYGIPVVTDPRDFVPDPWHTTPLQMATWTNACVVWEAGFAVEFPNQQFSPRLWGVGISLLNDHDIEYADPEADALKGIVR